MSLISVVIPLYNKEKSIYQTIRSVLEQRVKDFELIVVDDGSTDESLSVVQCINDNRIRLVQQRNGGVSSARNRGISESSSEYIAFLDGDDIWSTDHLTIMMEAIKKCDNDSVGGFGTTFYKSSHKVFDYSYLKKALPEVIDDYFEFMSSSAPRFNSSTLVVKKSKVLQTGLFNESLKYGEDVEFWYRLFSSYKLIYTNTITTLYHIGAENRSAQHVMPLSKRFHVLDYNNKVKSERKYLDKILALIVIDYFMQYSFKNVIRISYMYPLRMKGVLSYILRLIRKKY